jgi:4-amino-4-deoxy-L-arabinose transferase-like glycosyltransferase
MGLADLQPETLRRDKGLPAAMTRGLGGARSAVGLVLLLSLIVGVMAYQTPPSGRVQVGWLGDRLFLDTTSGLGAEATARGDFFADDLTPDSPTLRSRWAREYARVKLPNIGAGANLELSLTVQGWPDDVVGAAVAQPEITVRADGAEIGRFMPSSGWSTRSFPVPAAARAGADLTVELESSDTFTGTQSFGADPRPKAVRLAEVRVRAVGDDLTAVYPPAWRAVGLLAACALLLYLLLARLLRSTPAVFALTALGVGAAGVGLAFARIWMGAALSVALLVLGALLLLAWHGPLIEQVREVVRRYAQGRPLGYGLVAAALVLFGYVLAALFGWFGTFGQPLFWQIFPDSLLYGLLGAGLLALVLVLGRDGLPSLADGIVRMLGSRRGALALLASFGCLWIGYEAWVIAQLPYVGHADYSDNAVVARNLVAGRGWVVDYVTQFYHLEDGLTRPQETWPLLQPVWIAPFFMLFGPTAWAAKLPNLIFNLALLVLVYHIGARMWDRRVGLTAAVFLLSNYLFFRLTIYATNDLAFVIFSVGAIYALYRGQGTGDRGQGRSAPAAGMRGWMWERRYLLLSGVLTGLMMLQKPSGAMIALGMGLWLIGMENAACSMQKYSRDTILHAAFSIASWALVALLVLSPYLVRNMATFGRPVYSTESYDAWVLGYRGNSGDAWADIYRVFAPELGGIGVPDRSWVLRWGFDATITKVSTQAQELRNYLLPVWRGAPAGLGWLFSANGCASPASPDNCKNLLSDVGAWLALIGLIAALRFRRRLLGLLLAAYAPYVVFMLTYWRTDEHRYWVMLIPWLALLAAWTIWAGYDKLASIGDRRWAPLGLLLALAAVSAVVGFSRPDIADKVRNEPLIWQPDLAAYAWLDANVPEDTAVMTRLPWQLNWHTRRPALMIPNTGDRDELLAIARHYGVEYLVLENQLRVKGEAGDLLAPMMDHDNQVGAVIDGFELIYASPTEDFRAFVYRLPES